MLIFSEEISWLTVVLRYGKLYRYNGYDERSFLPFLQSAGNDYGVRIIAKSGIFQPFAMRNSIRKEQRMDAGY